MKIQNQKKKIISSEELTEYEKLAKAAAVIIFKSINEHRTKNNIHVNFIHYIEILDMLKDRNKFGEGAYVIPDLDSLTAAESAALASGVIEINKKIESLKMHPLLKNSIYTHIRFLAHLYNNELLPNEEIINKYFR